MRLAIALPLAAGLLLAFSPPLAAHDNPGLDGSWTIEPGESVRKENALALSACQVRVQGTLTLVRSTLTMSCLDGAAPTLIVERSGKLVLERNAQGGSAIRSADPAFGYFFVVNGTLQSTGADLSGMQIGVVFLRTASNSFLRDTVVHLSHSTGASIRGTSGLIIERSTFRDNQGSGLTIIEGAAPVVKASTVIASNEALVSAFAVNVDGASPRFEGNTVRGGGIGGVRLNNSAAVFTGNTVRDAEQTQLLIDQFSTATVRDNDLVGGSNAVVQVRASSPRIEENDIRDATGGGAGLRLDGAAAQVIGNTVRNARLGVLAVYSTGLRVEGNTFQAIREAAVLCGDAKETAIDCGRNVVLANNTASGSDHGIVVNKMEGVIRGNALTDHELFGVLALNRRPVLADNVFERDGAGGAMVAHDVKVRVVDEAGKPVSGASVEVRDAGRALPAVRGSTGSDGYLRVTQGLGTVDVFRLPDHKLENDSRRTDYNPYSVRVSKAGRETETFHYPVVSNSPLLLRLGKKPDLIGAVTLASGQLAAGERLAFDLEVTNAGTGLSPAATATFYLDRALLEARTLPSLAPGADRTERFEWTAVKGNHLALAVLDPENKLPEGDESNNQATLVFTVEGGSGGDGDGEGPPEPPGARPDLVIGGLVLSKTRSIVEGDFLALIATVTNAGEATAPPTTVHVLDDSVAVGDPVPVRSLAPGESWPVAAQWRASSGRHNVSLAVDAPGLVEEEREGNNVATRLVEVAPVDPGSGSGSKGRVPGFEPAFLVAVVLAALAFARRRGRGA